MKANRIAWAAGAALATLLGGCGRSQTEAPAPAPVLGSVVVPEFPTVPEVGDLSGKGVELTKWLGRKAQRRDIETHRWGIACSHCVKDPKPNAITLKTPHPCRPSPCADAQQARAEFEAGIEILRAAFEASQQGEKLTVELAGP